VQSKPSVSRLIFRRAGLPWSAHSPDLPFGSFSQWIGLSKDRVYANKLLMRTSRIRTKIRRFSHEMLERVITNFNVRAATVIQFQVAWIEHIINYRGVLVKWWFRRKNLPHPKLTCLYSEYISVLLFCTFLLDDFKQYSFRDLMQCLCLRTV